jgi:hypothetical protein
VSCWKIREWDLFLAVDDEMSIFVKTGLWVLGLSDRTGNCTCPRMSVKLGHERGPELRDGNISGKWKDKSGLEKSGMWVMGRGEREWDVENFSNDCMGGSGYI